MAAPAKGVWYVEFPTYRYAEDVVALAAENGLRVLDARFDDGTGVDGPKLTLRDEYSGEPAEEQSADESELFDVYRITDDGARGKRPSKANVSRDDAEAYVAERPDAQYEIVPDGLSAE